MEAPPKESEITQNLKKEESSSEEYQKFRIKYNAFKEKIRFPGQSSQGGEGCNSYNVSLSRVFPF